MTTKANSPPCASRSATSAATARLTPKARLAANRMIALDRQQSHDRERGSRPISAQTATMSMVIPTVMKNRPISRPLNGARSISIWWRYSVSDSSRPARKAPSAVERPATPVAAATPDHDEQRDRHDQVAAAGLRREADNRPQHVATGSDDERRPPRAACSSAPGKATPRRGARRARASARRTGPARP